MGVFSKLMTAHCSDIIHKDCCVKYRFVKTPFNFLSNARYFVPLTLLPLLLKIHKCNQSLLLNTFKYYAQCTVLGTFSAEITETCVCLFYHLMDGANPWTFLYVPSLITGITTFALSSKRPRNMFYTAIVQSVLELEIMKRNNWFTKTIAESTLCQTLIFMCCSAIILHAKRSGHYRGFWILLTTSSEQHKLSTDATETTTSVKKSKHQNVVKHLLSVVRNYMAIGLTLDFIKMLTSKIPNNSRTTNGVFGTLLAKLINFRFSSTALLTSYAGLYTFINQLGKYWLPESEWNEWIAGFIAGISYILLPKLTLLTYSITQCVGILWRYYELRPLSTDYDGDNKRRKRIRNSFNKLQNLLKHHVPFTWIIFPFALAHLVHTYGTGESNYPKLAEGLVNGLTNNYAYNLRQNVLALTYLFPTIDK